VNDKVSASQLSSGENRMLRSRSANGPLDSRHDILFRLLFEGLGFRLVWDLYRDALFFLRMHFLRYIPRCLLKVLASAGCLRVACLIRGLSALQFLRGFFDSFYSSFYAFAGV
jgi:hypothetical protein